MKSVADNLSGKERILLAALFEDIETMKALRSLLQSERINLATKALVASNYEEVKYLQGEAAGLKALVHTLKDIHTKEEKKNQKT